MLTRNVEGFNEFEIAPRRAWETQNSQTELAVPQMRLANRLLDEKNQVRVNPEADKDTKPARDCLIPDPPRRPE